MFYFVLLYKIKIMNALSIKIYCTFLKVAMTVHRFVTTRAPPPVTRAPQWGTWSIFKRFAFLFLVKNTG